MVCAGYRLFRTFWLTFSDGFRRAIAPHIRQAINTGALTISALAKVS